jgi:uncharacterized iron-regulated membrane protein
MSETSTSSARHPWPDYRAIWRWHFYAGLFCIPFVVVLAISGSIYLFKPQIEAWIDRDHDHLSLEGSTASAESQVLAAVAAVPGSRFQSYELPINNRAAGRVLVRDATGVTRVYVHPGTLAILKTVREDERLMKVLFRVHGELLMGNRGSTLVELAASWAIIMILTGLVLWWPRGANGVAGVVYPRLGRSSRVFWRDLHAVTGFWISGLALFLLLSGLPWAKFWGDYLKSVRGMTGTAVARQDWSNDKSRGGNSAPSGEHSGHGSSSGGSWRNRASDKPADLKALDRIVATVQPLGLAPPVVIAPPAAGSSGWTAKSMAGNRTLRVDLTLDGATGAITSRQDFRDRHLIDRVVGTGIAAHEGQLFGWPNQLLGVATALGLVLLSVSSVVLWWARRDRGVLGAPRGGASPRFSWGLLALVVLLGVYLPLFGASLIAVKLLEKAVLVRIPRVRDWLGLAAPTLATA